MKLSITALIVGLVAMAAASPAPIANPDMDTFDGLNDIVERDTGLEERQVVKDQYQIEVFYKPKFQGSSENFTITEDVCFDVPGPWKRDIESAKIYQNAKCTFYRKHCSGISQTFTNRDAPDFRVMLRNWIRSIQCTSS